jgi:hypothetical protein
MKKFTLFLSALLFSAMTFAAALGTGYSKVTDITTLSAGDKVVLYCDDANLGVTGWNGNKDATVAATGWVEYVVEVVADSVLLKDASAEQYIAMTAKNSFKYTNTGSACKVNASGVLYCTKYGADAGDYFLHENNNKGTLYYRMYKESTAQQYPDSYKPFYVYKVTGEVDENFVTPPTISGETSFMGTTTVKITAAEDLTIYYTTDGTEPAKNPDDEWENQYCGSFDINETTTVKAIAYDEEGNASAVVEKTFKKMEVLTCAEAAALCTTTASADKYVIRGYVTNIATAWSDQYQNISFWMADTKDGGQVLQAFRAKPVETAGIDVKVGDYVEIVGNLILYGETPEVNTGGLYTVANLTWAGNETNGYYINGLHPELGQVEIVIMKERWMGIWVLSMSIDNENVAEYVNIEGAPEISEDGVLTLETIVETDEAEYELNITAAKAAPVAINAEATMALSNDVYEAGVANVVGTWNGYDLVVKIAGWNYYGYGDYADASLQITKGKGDNEEVYISTPTAVKVEKQEDNSAILTAAFSYYTDKMTDYIVTITIANPIEPVVETVEVVSNDLELVISEEDWGDGYIYYYANMYGTCELGNIKIQFSYEDAGKTIDNLYGEWGFIETEHPMEPGLMVSYPLVTVSITPEAEGDEYVPSIDLTLVEGTVATYTDGELDTFEGQFLGSDWKLYNLKMTEAGNESAVENITTTVVPVKVIENGQLIIIKNGVKYNVAGAVVK